MECGVKKSEKIQPYSDRIPSHFALVGQTDGASLPNDVFRDLIADLFIALQRFLLESDMLMW